MAKRKRLPRGAPQFYFWLIGHWFARVLVFLVLAVVGFIAGANVPPPPSPAGSIICGLIGAALAWPLASIPIYYWRRQLRGGAAASGRSPVAIRLHYASIGAEHRPPSVIPTFTIWPFSRGPEATGRLSTCHASARPPPAGTMYTGFSLMLRRLSGC
jgi:hypothetical protein